MYEMKFDIYIQTGVTDVVLDICIGYGNEL